MSFKHLIGCIYKSKFLLSKSVRICFDVILSKGPGVKGSGMVYSHNLAFILLQLELHIV